MSTQTLVPEPISDDTKFDFQELNWHLDRVKSKVFLGRDAAFLGSLMCSLNFVWSSDVETAATDGETFWWNPVDFYRLPSEEERRATIEHELWHVARLHMPRGENRNPEAWNWACDIRINRDLRKEGYVLGPPWWIGDTPECPHEVEEEIYDWIMKNAPPPPKGGNQNGHMLPNAGNKQKMINAVVKAISQTKMAAGNKPGCVPGGIEKIVEKFLAPVIQWDVLLNQFFRDLLEEDYSWRRPNRRYDPNVLFLPSMVQDEGRLEHLCYYWDVSGSIGDAEEIRFNSEVKHIWEYFQPKKLTLVQFDTRITKIDEFNDGDSFNGIKIVGKGGTSFVPVRQHIIDNKPTAAIIFSDMECAPMQPLPPECGDLPVIWVAIRNRGATVPFGKIIHIKG